MEGSCHCGVVRIGIPSPPEYINACNCSICAKLGTAWCYFWADKVTITDAPLGSYRRNDLGIAATGTFFRCETCGTTTHWQPIAPEGRAFVAINVRLFAEKAMADVEIRHPNGRDWDRASGEPPLS